MSSGYASKHGFDDEIDRSGTAALKYDGRGNMFGTADVIPLWVADMDFAAPPAVTQALAQRAAHPIYGYTVYPESMYESLLAWLRRRHGWEVQREWIMMCPGVVPSIHAAVAAFTAPGDSVIVQPPVYFPFFSAVTSTSRQLMLSPLSLCGDRYEIDFDHLEQCAAHARLLLLCSPHNPVGRVWGRPELEKVLQIAGKHGLIVFSDEIHSDLVYPGQQHLPLSALAEASGPSEVAVITATAPSKTFNIPGLNLSVLIVPDPQCRKALARTSDEIHVSAANPFSIAAFESAYRGGEAWLDALLIYLEKTRDAVRQVLLTDLPDIRLIQPEGTYLLWLDCTRLKARFGMDDAQLQHFFVREAGVGMSPGTLFGEVGSGFMRMNIGAPRQVVEAALANIKKAERRLSKNMFSS